MPREPRLYTFAISHFSEKIRWTLDAIGMSYEEVPWTPVLHIPRALLKTRRATTVPILEVDGEVIQDSTDILLWLSRERAPFALMPADPAERQEVLAIEERFDDVGRHVLRYAYDMALRTPASVLQMWTVKSPPIERRLLSLVFTRLVPIFKKRFRIHAAEVARSTQAIGEALDWLDAHLADGRQYLVGDRLTVADITTAALLAPLACPSEHPIYGRSDYRKVIAPALEPFAGRPSLNWVQKLYETERHVRA